jgi:hypothetical protein
MALHAGEKAWRGLDAGAAREAAAAALSASPPVLLGAAGTLLEDLRLRARLEARLDQDRRALQADTAALGTGARAYVMLAETGLRQRLPATAATEPVDFRAAARAALAPPAPSPEEVRESRLAPLLGLLVWPVAWVIWALLLRGGVSFRVLGIALVRRDGRKAGRWQCAWRALLVWAPVTALLAASVELERLYWWGEGSGPVRDAVLLSLSNGAWWSAVGLLAAYLVLAIWLPQRSLHDRLAGTYLVPR